jgi:hypothetical protein
VVKEPGATNAAEALLPADVGSNFTSVVVAERVARVEDC